MIFDGFVAEWVIQGLWNGVTWRKIDVHAGPEGEDWSRVLVVVAKSDEELEEMKR